MKLLRNDIFEPPWHVYDLAPCNHLFFELTPIGPAGRRNIPLYFGVAEAKRGAGSAPLAPNPNRPPLAGEGREGGQVMRLENCTVVARAR